MNIRRLRREEVPLIWQIDRREIVTKVYDLENGKLVSKPTYFDIEINYDSRLGCVPATELTRNYLLWNRKTFILRK